MAAPRLFDADGQLWPALHALVDSAEPAKLRQQVNPDPLPYKVSFGHLSQEAYGEYGSSKRHTALSNLVAAMVDRLGWNLAGIVFAPSRQDISSSKGAAILYPARDLVASTYMSGLRLVGVRFGLFDNGTVRVVTAQEEASLWQQQQQQQQGLQGAGRLITVTDMDDLKYRWLLTANAMYLPHPQEAVLKVRGLPRQLLRQGAVPLLLQAAGYSQHACVCRAEYTMPAVLPGGQVAPWLEDPDTLCAVVAPPANDMLLAHLPRQLLLPGQPGKVRLSVQASKVRVTSSGPGQGAPYPGFRDVSLPSTRRELPEPVQQKEWQQQDRPAQAVASNAAAEAAMEGLGGQGLGASPVQQQGPGATQVVSLSSDLEMEEVVTAAAAAAVAAAVAETAPTAAAPGNVGTAATTGGSPETGGGGGSSGRGAAAVAGQQVSRNRARHRRKGGRSEASHGQGGPEGGAGGSGAVQAEATRQQQQQQQPLTPRGVGPAEQQGHGEAPAPAAGPVQGAAPRRRRRRSGAHQQQQQQQQQQQGQAGGPRQGGQRAAPATSANAEGTWSEVGGRYSSDADTPVISGRAENDGEYLFTQGVYDSMSSDDVEGMRAAMAEYEVFGAGYGDAFDPFDSEDCP